LRPEDQKNISTHRALSDACEAEYDLEVNLNKAISRSCDEAPPEKLAEKVLDLIRKSQSH
jgi:hypothetical protein